MELLNRRTFHDLIICGAYEVIRHKEELNAINVFPVNDGDTGSNLTHLMETIIRDSKWKEPSSDTLMLMKSACLRGSRGNSGMIFSQFIISMCNFLLNNEELKEKHFLDMCEQSVTQAYQAVATPQEGTILTVMKTWVRVMKRNVDRTKGIQEMLIESYGEVCVSLDNTMNQMELLRRHNVVDAGAKGFVLFLSGLITAIKKPYLERTEARVAPAFQTEAQQHEHAIEINHLISEYDDNGYRYCTEFLLNWESDTSTMKEQLAHLGDSLVLVGDEQQGKIHVHTNNPDQIADLLTKKGTIVYQKVDDMKRQFEILSGPKATIALVVDSACDLPQHLMDEHQIHLLPLQIQIGTSSYLDKVTLQPESFYDKLSNAANQPKSSQPSPESITRKYQELLNHYDHVVSIHVSNELSGTYNACNTVAKQVHSSRIHVINSRTLSGALGLLVLQAAEAIASGASIEEIKMLLSNQIPKSEILVSVPTLKYMVRGGRVSPLKGKVAAWLNLKPIVSLDREGKSILYGKTLFRKSNLGKMKRKIERIHQKYGVAQYVLLHAGAGDAIMGFQKHMESIMGAKPVYISDVSPVIGASAGKGAISVAMLLANDNRRGD
ncbi:DegV family protein [Cohnella sp. WQ 127256]|uniref:DegV family protein n=1 Tax=Cohnella sp. WQ 127256 TaxID=2938790 RepID=UPI0021173CCD|nr:DegV family protein [Cohnella sp. WQ 127256]